MSQYRVFLGLGSNMGERVSYLNRAATGIGRLRESRIVWASSVYETSPIGNTEQPTFLNAVIELETGLVPAELLGEIKKLEQSVGRVARERWGPREIDIDILLYDGLVVSDATVTVPHPELEKRRFVLVPLREIAPDVVHPVSGMTIEELAHACHDDGRIVKTQSRIQW
jgi:2-amino-4-hydroxy-6-hydroxymethyldihydropteridine diphosphokinase